VDFDEVDTALLEHRDGRGCIGGPLHLHHQWILERQWALDERPRNEHVRSVATAIPLEPKRVVERHSHVAHTRHAMREQHGQRLAGRVVRAAVHVHVPRRRPEAY